MTAPLLSLRGVGRAYGGDTGQPRVVVLDGIDLDIEAGEFVAIVGASGSGKSTLMNILGCLDQPSSGTYRVAGRPTGTLGADDLAALRRDHFGFIFQRYHLLGDLDAQGNVEMPAVYGQMPRARRQSRARDLLERLGLAHRLHHRPGQLSGGQQQRVSIARALMNGAAVILADEPTGALDSQSGEDVLAILKELHERGQTVIVVTHDMQVAAHAERRIDIRDGRIVADTRRAPRALAATARPTASAPAQRRHAWLDRLRDATRMALLSMRAHRLRTALTMLGIVIGIASVVSVVALGEGSRRQVLEDISAIGTNTIQVFSGSGFGDPRSQRVRTLLPGDALALAGQPYMDSVTPAVSSSVALRAGSATANATVNGVGEQFFRVRGIAIRLGAAFGADAVARYTQEAVIDANTHKTLFPGVSDPVGQVLLLGSVPVRVIGVAAAQDSPFGNADSLNVWVPYTTAMGRLLGQSYLNSITVRIRDGISTAAAEQGITRLLVQRHRVQDFFVVNSDSIRQTIESTTATMTLLISMIAVISLVVGGIGVMNIMLVSVTERTREIGVRMAVGARQRDILQQFLIEAVLVCLLGGLLGIAAALTLGSLFSYAGGSFRMVFSGTAMAAAVACSSLIGLAFGFLPARSAARLNPVDALARE